MSPQGALLGYGNLRIFVAPQYCNAPHRTEVTASAPSLCV